MKKKILYIFILLIITINMQAQHAIGSWQSYISYHDITRTEPAGSLIYAIGNGGLFSYDKEDNSVRCYAKGNPLNDTEITNIAYQSAYKTLIIVYANANIDLLINDTEVYNLPDLMNKNMNQRKEVNHIFFYNEYVYFSTPFGIIVLNLKKKEIVSSYILNKTINACAINGNTIYAASSEGLLTGLLTDNLLDVSNWKKVSDTKYKHLVTYNKELIGNILNNGIYIINKENYSYSQIAGGYYTFLNVYNDKLLAGNDNSLSLFDDLNTLHYMDHTQGTAHLSYSNGVYWGGCYEKGLKGFKYDNESKNLKESISSIIPNSPIRNYIDFMTIENERLLITGGKLYGNRLDRPGTIMMLDDHNWSSFQEKGISEQTKLVYRDISSVIEDPRDKRHHFAASVGEGLYEFYDQKFVKLYSLDNSTLQTSSDDPNTAYSYVRLNGLQYDNNNNLWMLNCTKKNTIHILKNNGKWFSLDSELADRNNLKQLMFDKRGWVWAISSWITDYGVFCLNTNGTLENTADDKHKFISNFANQDGNTLTHNSINCIVEDKEGAIWIGTGQGPIILNNPSKFFDNNFYCTQIKVPRNDGTNLADFLLANDAINTIAIDGANRKWIGTETNGVYLLSADGLTTIHHFTAENSPLISNSITAITIHPRTGEVFIGTSKGLVSYQSDATEGGEGFSSDVYAFPNPVTPDYTGLVTVTGLIRDTDIKITNMHGKLIHAGTSVGGQFTWDGKNQEGKRVPTGVYFVLAADAEGKEGVATKIVFIK